MKRALLFMALVLMSCSAAQMAGVPPELAPYLDTIGFYNDAPKEGTYETLGQVLGQYNPMDSSKKIQYNLKMQAYSAYGENAQAIVRVFQTIVPGNQFPLREVRGTVIKYK